MSNLINTLPLFAELGRLFATSGGVPGLAGCHQFGGRVARVTRGRAGAASEGAALYRTPTGVLTLGWVVYYAPFGDTSVLDAFAGRFVRRHAARDEVAAFHAAYEEAWLADAPVRLRTAAIGRLLRVAAIRRKYVAEEARAWRLFQRATGVWFAAARNQWVTAARRIGTFT